MGSHPLIQRNMREIKSDRAVISEDIIHYNEAHADGDKLICELLAKEISLQLTDAENKIWHRHPVWFLNGNPIVGYSKQKAGIRLMFWSGVDFGEEKLNVVGKTFKDASIFFNDVSEISKEDLQGWLRKSREIQWSYNNLIKRKGKLERIK